MTARRVDTATRADWSWMTDDVYARMLEAVQYPAADKGVDPDDLLQEASLYIAVRPGFTDEYDFSRPHAVRLMVERAIGRGGLASRRQEESLDALLESGEVWFE